MEQQDFTNEVWRDVGYYEGMYMVSNYGRVKGLYAGSEAILSPQIHRDGYAIISLSCLRKTFKVHRLVAKAFHPNPKNLPEIKHKNHIKTDNRACNLEWSSRAENMKELWAGDNTAKLKNWHTPKPVKQVGMDGKEIKVWPSSYSVQKEGYSPAGVSAVCNGRTKTHGGYRWEYANI